MWTVLMSGVSGFVTIITLCFCITSLEEQVLAYQGTYPFVGIFKAALGNDAGATVLCVIQVLTAFFACLTGLATASRQAWSLGRDDGLPFSGWFKKVSGIGGLREGTTLMVSRSATSVPQSLSTLSDSPLSSPSPSRFSIWEAVPRSTASKGCSLVPVDSATPSLSAVCYSNACAAIPFQKRDGVWANSPSQSMHLLACMLPSTPSLASSRLLRLWTQSR